MRIGGTGRVPSPKDRNWLSVGLKTSESVTGWLAGQPIRTRVHQGQRSKLCPVWYCGKNQTCERCESGKALSDLIFVPFYPDDSELRCVLHVHDDAVPALESLDLHDHFTAWRGVDSSTGVQITRTPRAVPFAPRIATRLAAACISEWLVRFMRASDWLTAEVLLSGGVQGSAGIVTEIPKSKEVTEEPSASAGDVSKTVIGLADQFRLSSTLTADGSAFSERKPDGRVVVREPHRNGKPK